MPHKKLSRMGIVTPSWVDALEMEDADSPRCLYTIVIQALVTKRAAENRGALNYPRLASAMRKADSAMQSIADGRAQGDEAWRTALAAFRKYSQAYASVDRIRREERGDPPWPIARSPSHPRRRKKKA